MHRCVWGGIGARRVARTYRAPRHAIVVRCREGEAEEEVASHRETFWKRAVLVTSLVLTIQYPARDNEQLFSRSFQPRCMQVLQVPPHGLLQTKLEELTPERVKEMMEEVIREHLGWLIVWGNVFGGTIGLVSKAMGY